MPRAFVSGSASDEKVLAPSKGASWRRWSDQSDTLQFHQLSGIFRCAGEECAKSKHMDAAVGQLLEGGAGPLQTRRQVALGSPAGEGAGCQILGH